MSISLQDEKNDCSCRTVGASKQSQRFQPRSTLTIIKTRYEKEISHVLFDDVPVPSL